MPKLQWDKTGEKGFEMGVDKGVLYPMNNGVYQKGVVWNGLTSVSESPEGGDENDMWADNIKYAVMRAAENFKGTIEAYQSPKEFDECDGTVEVMNNSNHLGLLVHQQPRKGFGFCYQTVVGNDSNDHAGYKIHIIYNCTCSPSDRSYETINDSPDAITLSWEYSSNPVEMTGFKPVSCLTIDSTRAPAAGLKALEAALYGVDADEENDIEGSDPRLPTPDEVVTLLKTTGAA